jgi:hypothetical protein
MVERKIEEVLKVLNGGETPVGWNDTNIILSGLIEEDSSKSHLKYLKCFCPGMARHKQCFGGL